MLIGSEIEHCPFIPFVIPDPRTADYKKISEVLKSGDQPPNLIFLAKKTFEEPPHLESVKIHVLHFNGIDKTNSTYFTFLDLVFSIIANNRENKIPYIGIASRSSPDFCDFFIVRWLKNECGYTLQDSLTLVKLSLSPGITKGKYLHQLARITSTSEHLIISDLDSEIQSSMKSNSKAKSSSLLNLLSSDSSISDDETDLTKPAKPLTPIKKETKIPIAETIQTNPYQKVLNIKNHQEPEKIVNDQEPKEQQQPLEKQPIEVQSQIIHNKTRLIELQDQYKQLYDYYTDLQNQMNQFQKQPPQYPQTNYQYQDNLMKKIIQAHSQLNQMHAEIESLQKDSSVSRNSKERFYNGKERSQEPISIEKAIVPQHSKQFLNEIITLLNVPNWKCLFPTFKTITTSLYDDLKHDLRSEQCEMCLMPEPQGERAILYLRRKVSIIIYQKNNKYTPIELTVNLNLQENDIFIFEIVFMRFTYDPSIIVLCDILYCRNEDVSSYEFKYRIGMLQECYNSIFKVNHESVLFAIRPFYKFSDFKLLTDLFEKNRTKKFVHYPLMGITVTAVSSQNEHRGLCMFLWTPYIRENPRAIIRIDLGSKTVYGSLQAGTSSIMAIYLGELNHEMFQLDGKVVEIRIVQKDPLRPTIVNGKIIGLARFDSFPWSAKKFQKYYPKGEPNLSLNQLTQLFATI